ncbi:MAG: SpoIID/LytB domain-containing protein [Candidatus Protochlamydia sp.]|nr:SpoIID/LytB domain-containing protein [Candidatus Protochlamydia sp.]
MLIVRWMLLILTILPFSSQVQAGIWSNVIETIQGRNRPPPPGIRILLVNDVEGVNLEVKGKYSLFDPYTDSFISSRFVGKSRYVQALRDGLKWGEAFPGLYQIKIKPDEPATVTTIDGKDYIGSVYIYDIGGTISLVNQIPIEDYVRLVLGEYSNKKLNSEMLSALAIMARTNAYFQAINPKNTFWAVDAQKIGYEGQAHVPSAIEEAVQATRYMIMSKTGVYEGMVTPFLSQMDGKVPGGVVKKEIETSKLSLEEANSLAEAGEHAAMILGKAFPGSTIMLMEYSN